MKILDIPQSGKCGSVVAYDSDYGQCLRQYVVPANPQSAAQQRMRTPFGGVSRAWATRLTERQRRRWEAAGRRVESARRMESGGLSGQMHFVGINSARACVGREMLLEPPAPVALGANPVGRLAISNGEGGIRLELAVSGPMAEEVMVFGQAPCSAGRMKRRNVSFLGLLPAPVDGASDITQLYVAKHGEPRAGSKVFIVTRQQKEGWEGYDRETSEIVPGKATEEERVGARALALQPHMY